MFFTSAIQLHLSFFFKELCQSQGWVNEEGSVVGLQHTQVKTNYASEKIQKIKNGRTEGDNGVMNSLMTNLEYN